MIYRGRDKPWPPFRRRHFERRFLQLKLIHWNLFLIILLKWKDHNSYICEKIKRGIGMTIKARNYLNKNGLMVLCYSFVYLYLMYCTHIWGSTYKTTLRRLVILQNKVVRIISDVKPRNSAGPLYKAFNIMKCEDINIQIKYGLPYCVTCPSMSTDPGSPNPGARRIRVLGAGDTGQVTQFWQNILNLYYSTGSWKLFHTPYWHSVSEGGSVSSSWKWWPVIMSPAHNPLLLQLPILLHSMTVAVYI